MSDNYYIELDYSKTQSPKILAKIHFVGDEPKLNEEFAKKYGLPNNLLTWHSTKINKGLGYIEVMAESLELFLEYLKNLSW